MLCSLLLNKQTSGGPHRSPGETVNEADRGCFPCTVLRDNPRNRQNALGSDNHVEWPQICNSETEPSASLFCVLINFSHAKACFKAPCCMLCYLMEAWICLFQVCVCEKQSFPQTWGPVVTYHFNRATCKQHSFRSRKCLQPAGCKRLSSIQLLSKQKPVEN